MNNDCNMMKMTSRLIMPMSPRLMPVRKRATKIAIKPCISRTISALFAERFVVGFLAVSCSFSSKSGFPLLSK